ncbi:MAG: SdpI family protein [Ignavibacteriales bacterium]
MKNRVLRPSPLLIIVTLACLAVGIWAYPRLPDRVPTHWNFRGEVDGWSSKTFGVFGFPAMALGFYLLFEVLPSLDPHKKKYEQFAGSYSMIRAALVLFMDGIYLITLMAGLGYAVNIGLLVRLGVSLLFVFLGDRMGKIKQNWFVGFRTPWTLASQENWRRTHRFGAKTMVAGGLLSLLTLPFDGPAAAGVFFAFVMAGAILPVGYSYLLFRKGI